MYVSFLLLFHVTGPFAYETRLRNRKYKTRCRPQSEMVKKAIEAVAAGMSLRKAAKMYSMSKSVLHRYTKMSISFM